MNGKAKWTVVSAALWVTALSCRAETPEIRVRLHVYAPVSAPALKRAREVASNVLLQAGVRLSWAQCSIREEEPTQDAACLERLTPLDLQLRIVDRTMAKLKGGGADSMGYALLADEFNSIAAAYFHRAVELEGSNYAGRGEILGAIMAHEIGHLLGVTRHSDAGIMRGDWQDQELKSIAKGRLGFTEDQARVIEAAIVRRQQATVSTAGR